MAATTAFYGTTWGGGELGFGTVFRLLLPLTPEMLGVEVLSSRVSAKGVAVRRSADVLAN